MTRQLRTPARRASASGSRTIVAPRRSVIVPRARSAASTAFTVARAAHHEQRLLAEPRRTLDGEAAAVDEVQRIGRVVLVEDDLAALELPAPGDAEDAPDVLVGHPRQQLPLHVPSLLRCVAYLTFPPSNRRTTRELLLRTVAVPIRARQPEGRTVMKKH